jgi:PAS domain S-box-containing protein
MKLKPANVALRACLIYGLVSGIWIVGSDWVLEYFITDVTELARMEMHKGTSFVVLTSVMLFFVIRKLVASEQEKFKKLRDAEGLARLQREILELIAKGSPLNETLDQLVQGIEKQSPGMICSILLMDETGIKLLHAAGPSLPHAYNVWVNGFAIGPKAGSCGTAAFRGSPVFVSDIATDPLWEDIKDMALTHGLAACWSTPILNEQKNVLGTFAVYDRKPGLPDEEAVRMIEIVTHTVATAITKKRMETDLRAASERKQFYMDRMPLAFIAWDRDFKVAEWNAAAEKIFGWSAREAIGRHAFELIVPAAVQPEVSRVWEEIIRTGSLMSHSINENTTRDGRIIICDWRNTPWRDASGAICGCLSLVGDITEQQQAEEKFAREQARFKLIFDSIPIGIAFHTVHPDGSFTRTVNDAHIRICGIKREQHYDTDIYRRISHPDDYAIQKQFMDQVNAGNLNHFSLEKRYLRPDGTTVWVNYSYQRADYPNGTKEELTTVADITERKQLEEQLRQSQKMEAIGQLSGGIAHDFNNILTVIQGNASLLQEIQLKPEGILDCSNQIVRAAERAAGLTRQLLMFARNQQIQPVDLSLNEVVAHITRMLQRILGEDITLHTEYAPDLPLIHADVGMIEQIVLNLVVNARDAMLNGGKLTLRTGVEGDHVCLQITDTGCGIPQKILPHIFEPFFTTKEVGKGTGLGLATVYGIVQQHHGKIAVQSQPDRGTTFTISFPASQNARGITNESAPKPVLARGDETILVVEDELPLRTFVCNLLKHCGYTVIESASGASALKLWATHHEKIALLFTDIIMPEDLNGLDLGRQLLAEKPKLKVIYTSGYTGNLEGQRSAQLVEGINFIRKPYKPETLTDFIRNCLDKS